MAGDPFGVSFSPSQTGGTATRPGQQGNRPTPIQQAIQTLSLHIPKNAGASAFTPQTLLEAPGSGGAPDTASMLEMIKRLLFGQRQPGQIGTQPVPVVPNVPPQNAPGGSPNFDERVNGPSVPDSGLSAPSWAPPAQPAPSAPPAPPTTMFTPRFNPGEGGPQAAPMAPPVPRIAPGGAPDAPGLQPTIDESYVPQVGISPAQPSETSFTPPSFAGNRQGRDPFTRGI